MATPPMTAVNVSATITKASAGTIRITTLDAAGAALDVSSGYSVGFMHAVPSANNNIGKTAVDLSSDFTPAFDATGVSLAYTAAQASTIVAALATLSSSVGFGLSNDSGTTKSLAAKIALTVQPNAELQ